MGLCWWVGVGVGLGWVVDWLDRWLVYVGIWRLMLVKNRVDDQEWLMLMVISDDSLALTHSGVLVSTDSQWSMTMAGNQK